MREASKPTSEPDYLPAFQVNFETLILATDHDAAMEVAANWLERMCGEEAFLDGGVAQVSPEPVEFFDE